MLNSSIRDVRFQAERAVDQAADSRWLEVLGRVGIGSLGIVHLVIGAYALRLALGNGGRAMGSKEAVHELGRIGVVPLVVIAFGLAGYAVLRVVQAVADTEGKGRTIKGILTRASFAVSGLLFGALVPVAVKLALGQFDDPRDTTKQTVATWMSIPAGRVAVFVVGGVVLYSSFAHLVEAWRAIFAEDFDGCALARWQQALAVAFGRVGIAARGLVLFVVGFFLMRAAWDYDSEEAKGVGEALLTLRIQPYGGALFMAVAIGILSYAFFCFVYARHRRIGHVR